MAYPLQRGRSPPPLWCCPPFFFSIGNLPLCDAVDQFPVAHAPFPLNLISFLPEKYRVTASSSWPPSWTLTRSWVQVISIPTSLIIHHPLNNSSYCSKASIHSPSQGSRFNMRHTLPPPPRCKVLIGFIGIRWKQIAAIHSPRPTQACPRAEVPWIMAPYFLVPAWTTPTCQTDTFRPPRTE